MNPILATLVYTCGIAGLFYLDRDTSIRTSKALWLPVLYLWIIGSRPISVWLGGGSLFGGEAQLEGSPIDGTFYTVLLIAALCVLTYRAQRTPKFLVAYVPIPILIFFLFCLASVCWSDFPVAALKKWVKSIGDLAMILIVLTDGQPVFALRRLFSRCAFILLPISMLFIKYFPYLGHTYDAWSGMPTAIGITTNKNSLGLITFVLSLGAIWRVLVIFQSDRKSPDRRRHLLAQGTVLGIGIWLLVTANSATSTVCFVLGAGLMLATSRKFLRRNPALVHVLILSLVLFAGLALLFGGGASAAHALGRNATLTGRTEIWAAVIPLASNPLVGAGFESFWLSPRVHEMLWRAFPGLPLNEAHDGYIEIYLNLGWVGLGILGALLIDGYRRSVKAFRRDPALGGLLLAYILTAIIYSITEAGFRMLAPMWIFSLLAVIKASSIAGGFAVGALPPLNAPSCRVTKFPAEDALTRGPGRGSMPRKIVRRQSI